MPCESFGLDPGEAGANSIFIGDKLLTTPNSNAAEDEALLAAIQ